MSYVRTQGKQLKETDLPLNQEKINTAQMLFKRGATIVLQPVICNIF